MLSSAESSSCLDRGQRTDRFFCKVFIATLWWGRRVPRNAMRESKPHFQFPERNGSWRFSLQMESGKDTLYSWSWFLVFRFPFLCNIDSARKHSSKLLLYFLTSTPSSWCRSIKGEQKEHCSPFQSWGVLAWTWEYNIIHFPHLSF